MPLEATKQTEGQLNEVKTPMQRQNNTSAILIKANKTWKGGEIQVEGTL